MRSWSDSTARSLRGPAAPAITVAIVIALAPAAGWSADPPSTAAAPESTTIWGYGFVELFAHVGISTLAHRGANERINLTLIRDVAPETAADFIDDEIILFESLFTLKRTGYPGQTTRYIECPPELRPRYAEAAVGGNTFRYFCAFANANFVAGVSAPDLAAYRLIKGFLFCRELGVIFEIEHFSPLDGDDLGIAFLDRLGCPAALP